MNKTRPFLFCAKRAATILWKEVDPGPRNTQKRSSQNLLVPDLLPFAPVDFRRKPKPVPSTQVIALLPWLATEGIPDNNNNNNNNDIIMIIIIRCRPLGRWRAPRSLSTSAALAADNNDDNATTNHLGWRPCARESSHDFRGTPRTFHLVKRQMDKKRHTP